MSTTMRIPDIRLERSTTAAVIYAVQHGDGRVLSYSMRFPSGTGIAEAKALILAGEFPGDAKIAWFKVKDSCAQMFVGSKTVAHALQAGGALVEFSSGEAGDYYESSNVSEAILIALPGLGKDTEC